MPTPTERMNRLERLLPLRAPPDQCLDGAQLLERMGSAYSPNETAARRALQYDLKWLVEAGRIEAVNPGGKPFRYRRLVEDRMFGQDTLEQLRTQVAEAVSKCQFDRLWQKLLTDKLSINARYPVLDETRLRILPDALRLKPPDISAKVLSAVIEALAQRCVLQVLYQKADGERSDACLHPQALVQRGPIPYLFALKNNEEGLRLYALQRMIHAEVLTDPPVREMEKFNLDQAIAEGVADFGPGESVAIELRVRGYLTSVIQDCPLSDDQLWDEEPEGSNFDIRVWATVPSSGVLLRWLLGAGDNLEVVAPSDLRRAVSVQAAKMARLY